MIYLIIFLRKIKYFFGKSQCDCSAENKKENYYKIAISTRKLFYTVRFGLKLFSFYLFVKESSASYKTV